MNAQKAGTKCFHNRVALAPAIPQLAHHTELNTIRLQQRDKMITLWLVTLTFESNRINLVLGESLSVLARKQKETPPEYIRLVKWNKNAHDAWKNEVSENSTSY